MTCYPLKYFRMVRWPLLLLLNLLLTFQPLQADELQDTETQARNLQHLYAGLTSLTFDFKQVTIAGGRERTGKGKAVFFKPLPAKSSENGASELNLPKSVMRWDYTEPDRQIIINDGTTLLIYTEKDKQMIKTPAKELESDITYAFFAGTRNVLDDFIASAPTEEVLSTSVGALQTLLLVPRTPNNQIKTVQIWFDDQGIIHRMLLTDHFETNTDLRFSSIVLNSLQPDNKQQLENIISFQPPPGTEIITR